MKSLSQIGGCLVLKDLLKVPGTSSEEDKDDCTTFGKPEFTTFKELDSPICNSCVGLIASLVEVSTREEEDHSS